MKNIIIKISILLVLLAAVTVIFAQQDVEVRMVFDKETLIRHGRQVTLTVDTGKGGQHIIAAETRHHSIYEYIAKLPASVWRDLSQVRFEIGQVRRDDRLYIDSISVKHPLFAERTTDSGSIYKNLNNLVSADAQITGDMLILDVTATRAHTPDMSTEGPSFSLPGETLRAAGAPGTAYVLCILAVAALWAIAAFAVPDEVYASILQKLRDTIPVIRDFGAIDAAIAVSGIASLVFFFYGGSITGGQNQLVYNFLSVLTILFVVIKVLSNRPHNDGADSIAGVNTVIAHPPDNKKSREWMTYVFFLLLGLAVYIPACFRDPYFNNDEHQVIGAAEWYLANGNYEQYSRAWPHTWMVAQAIRFFGLSTVSTRIVSAIWGAIFIVSVYHVVKQISKQKNIALLSAMLLVFSNLIGIFNTVRMYAVMLPISLWLFYCIYMTLHCEIQYKQDNAATRFITRNFNFHFGYAAAAIFLIWFNFNIHINAMMILPCAVVYVFIAALVTRERKFLNLVKIGLILLLLFVAVFFLTIYTTVRVPVFSSFAIILYRFATGFGRVYNYDYFWGNIVTPLRTFFSISLLLVAFATCIGSIATQIRKKTTIISYTVFPMVTYAVTLPFFIWIADRYYSVTYMIFLAPITIMLISSGFFQVLKLLKAPARLAIYAIVIAAIFLQLDRVIPAAYLDSYFPKYTRPYEMIVNDAKNEDVDTINLFHIYSRSRYFDEIVENGNAFASPRGQEYQIDFLLDNMDKEWSVIYYYSDRTEAAKWVKPVLSEFLNNAADFITIVDSSRVHKLHFVKPIITEDSIAYDDDFNFISTGTFNISAIQWEDDVAYISCEMQYISEFEQSRIIAVEVTEQGIAQSAAHRYQVLIPEGFEDGNILGFTLPVRPKTEEYAENINFGILNRVYVYYGEDETAVIELN